MKNRLLTIILLLNIIAFYLFVTSDFLNNQVYGNVTTFFWSLNIVLLGIWSYRKHKHKYPHWKSILLSKEFIIVSIIILLALLIRLYKVGYLGIFLDDWWWLDMSRQINAGTVSTPFGYIGDQPSNMPGYLVYLFYQLSGHSPFAVRFAGIFISILAIIAVFFLLKKFFNSKTAIVGVFLMSTSIWDIYVCKIPWINTTINPLLIIGTLYFFYLGIKKRNYWQLFLGGVFLGTAINQVYIAALITLPLAIFSLIKLYQSKFNKSLLKYILFFFTTCVIVCYPTIIKTVRFPEITIGRHESFVEKNIVNSKDKGTLEYYIDETVYSLTRFVPNSKNYQENTYPYWGMTIEWNIFIPFLIGLTVLIYKIREEKIWFLFINWIVLFIPLVFLERGISNWREYSFLPFIYITASVGISYMASLLAKILKKSVVIIYIVILAIFFLFWIQNFSDFHKYNFESSNFIYEERSKQISTYLLDNFGDNINLFLPDEMATQLIGPWFWDNSTITVYSDSKQDLNLSREEFIKINSNKKIIILIYPSNGDQVKEDYNIQTYNKLKSLGFNNKSIDMIDGKVEIFYY